MNSVCLSLYLDILLFLSLAFHSFQHINIEYALLLYLNISFLSAVVKGVIVLILVSMFVPTI